MQNILTENGYVFRKHLPCCNICQPDIMFPEEKIIIQCDGDYWHDYPNGLDNNIEECLYRFELEYWEMNN